VEEEGATDMKSNKGNSSWTYRQFFPVRVLERVTESGCEISVPAGFETSAGQGPR